MASMYLFRSLLSTISLCLCVFLHGGVSAGMSGDNSEYFGDPEMTMKACELAAARGYKCEEHEVETEDGYILTLHRLPVTQNKHCDTIDKVVLFAHGFLGSSTNFLINGPKESLSYLFSEACHDVWLTNARGNTYSLKHNTYTSDDEEFWRFRKTPIYPRSIELWGPGTNEIFEGALNCCLVVQDFPLQEVIKLFETMIVGSGDVCFDEMARYDLPATIEYILQKTNQKTLNYIGHSQGVTIGLEAFSENKTLAKKIGVFAALGPVGYAANVQSKLTMYASMSDESLYVLYGHKSFYGPDWKRDLTIRATCNNGLTRGVCVKLGEALGGKLSPSFDETRIGLYFMHTPAGSSVQNLVHWAQMMRSNKTRKYSHVHPEDNKAIYGSEEAPELTFSEMDLPIIIFTGGHDIIANKQDADHLISELPNMMAHIRIPDYSHLDFIYATNAEKTIFKPLSFLMGNY